MKKIIARIGGCLLVCCILGLGAPTVRAQSTTAEKSATTKKNRNLSKKAINPANHLSRRGHLYYPHGLDNNKTVNMGYQLGGSLALNDALREEKCAMGANLDLYLHFILKNSNTLAMGTEIKAFYFLTNADNFSKQICAKPEEGLAESEVSTGNWMAGAVQFSLLSNFNATARCNIQLKANAGPLVVMVPENKANYQVSEIQLDNTAGITTTDIQYKSGMSIGAAATLGADLLYAISRHTEIKGGVDWTYMRFSYDRTNTVTKQGQDPVQTVTNELRQFGVFNLHFGLAHSF